jgi:hypothetical protein
VGARSPDHAGGGTLHGDFTPPAVNSFYRGPEAVSRALPQTLASAFRFAQLGEPTERTLGIQALRRFAPNPQIGRGVMVRNVALGYQAGDRTVALSGTTKVKALPADLPVARPVRLYRNDTGALVARDAVVGRWELHLPWTVARPAVFRGGV